MAVTMGGRFCDCTICGKQFMGKCGQSLYYHMKRDHKLEHKEAFKEAGESLNNHVVFEQFAVPGIAF